MTSRISNPFFKRKLTVLALALYFSAVFLPWLVENYTVVVEWRYPEPKLANIHGSYWSFMAHNMQTPNRMGDIELYSDKWLYFHNFWISSPSASPVLPSFQGLYLGWLLLFIIQVWMAVLCFSHRLKWIWLLRGWEATAIVTSAFFSSTVGFCQIITHYELFTAWGRISEFPLGWAVSTVSFVLLTISYWKSPEHEQMKRIFSSIKRSWKLSLAAILILASVSLLVNEFQF